MAFAAALAEPSLPQGSGIAVFCESGDALAPAADGFVELVQRCACGAGLPQFFAGLALFIASYLEAKRGELFKLCDA